MKRVIYLLLLGAIAGSCRSEETLPEPVEELTVRCEPEEPVLYGELSGMRLRVIKLAQDDFMLMSVTEDREGLKFAEPRLKNILPSLFSGCNIPQNFLKDDLVLRVTGYGYIDNYMMQNAKIVYFDNPNTQLRMTYKIFLDYTEIEVEPQ